MALEYPYPSHPTPDCHLLMHRNRLQRDLGEDGRYHFRSIDPDLERRAHPGRHDAPDDQPIMV